MMPSLKALGFFGSIRRLVSKPFRRRVAGDGWAAAPLPPAEERRRPAARHRLPGRRSFGR